MAKVSGALRGSSSTVTSGNAILTSLRDTNDPAKFGQQPTYPNHLTRDYLDPNDPNLDREQKRLLRRLQQGQLAGRFQPGNVDAQGRYFHERATGSPGGNMKAMLQYIADYAKRAGYQIKSGPAVSVSSFGTSAYLVLTLNQGNKQQQEYKIRMSDHSTGAFRAATEIQFTGYREFYNGEGIPQEWLNRLARII